MDLSKLSDEQLDIALKVANEAKRQGLNPDFVLPMVMQESGFNTNLTSKKGAYGVMQLMPDTAKGLNVDPRDVDQNIRGGVSLLKELISNPKIGIDPYKVLAAYNTSTETRNKFLESGDLSLLPDETINHMIKVSDIYGKQLPSLILGEATQQEQPKAQEEVDETVSSSEETVPSTETVKSTPSANIPPIIGGMAGSVAGSTVGSGAAALKVKKDLAIRGLEMAGLIKKPDVLPTAVGVDAGDLTPGEKWGQKTGYGMGQGTVQESSSRYQRNVPQGKVSGRMAKRFGVPLQGESPDLVQRMIDRKKLAEETAQAAEVAAAKAAQSSESPLFKYAKGLASLPVKGALSGLGAGYGAVDVYNRAKQGLSGEALTSGLGTVASTVAPFVGGVASPLLATAGLAVPLYLSASDRLRYLKEHPEAYQLPETVNGMRFGPMGEPYQ